MGHSRPETQPSAPTEMASAPEQPEERAPEKGHFAQKKLNTLLNYSVFLLDSYCKQRGDDDPSPSLQHATQHIHEPPSLRIFTLYRPAADGLLRRLLPAGPDPRQGHLRELPPLAAHHGLRPVAAGGQLCGAPLLRDPVAGHQRHHPDEPLDLFPLLLALQFGPHHAARPLLHHATPPGLPPDRLASLHPPLGRHPAVAARRPGPEDRTDHHGRLADLLRTVAGPPPHRVLPPGRAAFRQLALRRHRRLHPLALDLQASAAGCSPSCPTATSSCGSSRRSPSTSTSTAPT